MVVPSATSVRDLREAPLVQHRRHGSLAKAPFRTVAVWAAAQPEERRSLAEVRAGEKGPVLVAVLETRVQTRRDAAGRGRRSACWCGVRKRVS